MKENLLMALSALVLSTVLVPAAWSQDRIYRCGNEYTNNASQAKERNCKLVEGGNVTVLQGSRPPVSPAAAAASAGRSASATASSPPSAPRVANNDQRSRDSDARAILGSELRKAETHLADLKAEYNDGAPQRNALDLRNPQVYMERTADLKARLTRAESDVAGIRRELGRTAPSSAP